MQLSSYGLGFPVCGYDRTIKNNHDAIGGIGRIDRLDELRSRDCRLAYSNRY